MSCEKARWRWVGCSEDAARVIRGLMRVLLWEVVRRAEVFEMPRARASTHLTTGLVGGRARERRAGAGEESMERISKLVERRWRGGSRALVLQYFRRW